MSAFPSSTGIVVFIKQEKEVREVLTQVSVPYGDSSLYKMQINKINHEWLSFPSPIGIVVFIKN